MSSGNAERPAKPDINVSQDSEHHAGMCLIYVHDDCICSAACHLGLIRWPCLTYGSAA